MAKAICIVVVIIYKIKDVTTNVNVLFPCMSLTISTDVFMHNINKLSYYMWFLNISMRDPYYLYCHIYPFISSVFKKKKKTLKLQ